MTSRPPDTVLRGLLRKAEEGLAQRVTIQIDGQAVSGVIVAPSAYREGIAATIGEPLRETGVPQDDAFLHLEGAVFPADPQSQPGWFRCRIEDIQSYTLEAQSGS